MLLLTRILSRIQLKYSATQPCCACIGLCCAETSCACLRLEASVEHSRQTFATQVDHRQSCHLDAAFPYRVHLRSYPELRILHPSVGESLATETRRAARAVGRRAYAACWRGGCIPAGPGMRIEGLLFQTGEHTCRLSKVMRLIVKGSRWARFRLGRRFGGKARSELHLSDLKNEDGASSVFKSALAPASAQGTALRAKHHNASAHLAQTQVFLHCACACSSFSKDLDVVVKLVLVVFLIGTVNFWSVHVGSNSMGMLGRGVLQELLSRLRCLPVWALTPRTASASALWIVMNAVSS